MRPPVGRVGPGLVALATLGACGGSGSGVDASKPISTLTPDEQQQLCLYFAEAYPPRTVVCSPMDLRAAGASSVPVCVAALEMLAIDHPGCAATVAQSESCEAALDRRSDLEICAATTPSLCAPLRTPDCSN